MSEAPTRIETTYAKSDLIRSAAFCASLCAGLISLATWMARFGFEDSGARLVLASLGVSLFLINVPIVTHALSLPGYFLKNTAGLLLSALLLVVSLGWYFESSMASLLGLAGSAGFVINTCMLCSNLR